VFWTHDKSDRFPKKQDQSSTSFVINRNLLKIKSDDKIIQMNKFRFHLQIKEHNDSCQKTKTSVIEPFAKAFLPAMGPTGIHFLSHFLEEKILRSQHPSLLDEREISPPQKPQTALQLDIESKSTVSMMNNSQQVYRKQHNMSK